MSTHTFRITVRGFFEALTPAQRRELLAEADQHDILRATYTTEGHLSYDLSAREAFAFRFLATGEEELDIIDATKRAETATATWLTGRGYGYKNLRSQAVDLTLAPLSKRQRRAAAGGR
jgi:Family of unknown function (DUF6204)